METTAYVSDYPALTDVTNGIEVFMVDMAEANGNQNKFFDSVARYCNNIINAIKSCADYFSWLHDCADSLYNSNSMPIWVGSACGLCLFFLVLGFVRK